MKRFRLPLVVAGAVAFVFLLLVAVAFSSAFQTWAVRRAIAKYPEIDASVGVVSAGLKRVRLEDVRVTDNGAVLTLPLVEVDLPLFAAIFDEKVHVSRLVAKGWTLELSHPPAIGLGATPASLPTSEAAASTPHSSPGSSTPPAPSAGAAAPAAANSAATSANASAATATAPNAAAEAFSGIFGQLRFPIEFSVDGVQLEGHVVLPASRGTVKVSLAGGGLAANHEGRFEVVASAALKDPSVKTVAVRGMVVAAMDTPRSFTRLGAKLDASASGTKFPDGVKLHADIGAARTQAGETYSAALVSAGQDVISVNAALPRSAQAFGGAWKINVRDTDVAPFALGLPLPTFTAVGEGKFDGDARFEAIHLTGRLESTIDRLEAFMPELRVIGEIKVATDFDLAERAGHISVERFEAVMHAVEPVATVRVLQPFAIHLGRAELRTADPARELVALVLHGVPVQWAAPFAASLQLDGGHLRGELSVAARDGGMSLRSTTPLQVDGVAVAQAGRTLLEKIDLRLNASGDYTPRGWQAELTGFNASSGEATLVAIDAKVGQLAGANQPLKATGTLRADLPSLLAQPIAAGNVFLTSGKAAADFVVSVSEKNELEADLKLEELATVVDRNAVKLPSIATKLRADLSGDGKIAFNAPILIQRGERKSDLTLVGTLAPERDGVRAIDATVTSQELVIEDAQILAAAIPEPAAPVPPAKSPTDAPPAREPAATTPRRADPAPPWAGLSGVVALQLKRIIYSDAVQVNNVTGRLRLDAGMLKLEGLQAGLGETGRADVNGLLSFDTSTPQPYALVADVAVREFDPAPLFRSMSEGQPATVEGKFDVTSKVEGRAATLLELATGAGGSFQLTSKGGVFRGLPVDVGHIVENTSKLAAWLASAGTAISAITGKKDYTEVANKAEAVAELARGLNPIPYDQLSVSFVRDAALNTTLRNFTLISPEVRLTGSGMARHEPGSCLLENSLAMEFTLRARGRQGELLKYLGALEGQTDDLGYATCTVPLKIGGTLGRPDTSELNTKLTALAIEKSGFGDKAAEFLNKIRGGK
jgi:hypothetical protein